MTIIKHKRGSGVPAATELEVGELAIDTLAAKLYTKIGNAVVELGGGDSSDGGSPVHIGDTAPPDPSEGDLWYDTSSDTLLLFNGSDWIPTSSSGDSGAGMVISDTEPADKVTGMQWLEASTSKVWIWDEDKWLRFPAADGLTEGGGGGGAWESIAVITADAASSFEVDLDPSEFMSYKFFLDVLPSGGSAEVQAQLWANGSWFTSSEYTTEYFSGRRGVFEGKTAKTGKWILTGTNGYENTSHFSALLSGIGETDGEPAAWAAKPAMSFIGAGGSSTNNTIFWTGAGSLNLANTPIEKIKFWCPTRTWQGSLIVEGLRRA